MEVGGWHARREAAAAGEDNARVVVAEGLFHRGDGMAHIVGRPGRQHVARGDVAEQGDVPPYPIPHLMNRMLEAEVEEVDTHTLQQGRAFRPVRVIVEEAHVAVNRSERAFEVGRGKSRRVIAPEEPDDVVQQHHAPDGRERAGLKFEPVL